jgi:hypothetical protein
MVMLNSASDAFVKHAKKENKKQINSNKITFYLSKKKKTFYTFKTLNFS